MADLNALSAAILIWGEDRGILKNSTALHQIAKTYEEVNELHMAILNNDIEGIIDGIGDTMVTLTMITGKLGLDLGKCVESSYKVISQRKGQMINGIFVKEEQQ